MNIETKTKRVAVNLTIEEAMKLIEELSKSVNHANKVGGAYFTGPAIFENENGDVAGRVTFRVER